MNHGGLGRDVVVVVAAASVGVLIRGGERAPKKGEKRNRGRKRGRKPKERLANFRQGGGVTLENPESSSTSLSDSNVEYN